MDRQERLDLDKRIKQAVINDYRVLDMFLKFVPYWAKRRYIICQDKNTNLNNKSSRAVARIFNVSQRTILNSCDCDIPSLHNPNSN